MPAPLRMDTITFEPWGRLALLAAAVVIAALVAHRLLRPLALRVTRWSMLLRHVVQRSDRPLQWLLPLVALNVLWQGVPDTVPAIGNVQHVTAVLTIAAATWLASGAIGGVADGIIAMHPADVADNLHARRVQTQTRVLARVVSGVVLFAGVAFVLMTFPRARQLGTSLLASAGVAGLIVGIAAKSVFSNLLSGLQIALAQPIRIDDVLIVKGEYGRVEEITSTYVVLKIWDERRLVVPLQWFIENPFENWTRRGAAMLGTVTLWVDYTLPLEPVRAEARRLCEGSKFWDRRLCMVQVVDSSERAMQIRVLLSAASSGEAWDLRCEVREGLIAYILREHREALPRLRAEAATHVLTGSQPSDAEATTHCTPASASSGPNDSGGGRSV